MSCTLQLQGSSSAFGYPHSSSPTRRKPRHLQILSSASTSGSGNIQDSESQRGEGSSGVVVLLEKYSNGTAKRYILDDESRAKTFLEKHAFESDKQQSSYSITALSWLPHFIQDFILPAGFPVSVSDDYLEYMLWQFPTNVTAWICHTLVTSSLLKAVGVSSLSGTAAAASAAAIRWVSKDGIGAVGRLIIGGRFGNLFDDDPKQWRMYADFIGSAGSIFDLSTQLYPAYFLPLASLGNLTKAVARGLKDPSFRVIQNHFAVSGNLGDVAAKINTKRACILARSHVLHSTVPGCIECNRAENILSWQRFLKPRIIFGASWEEMVSDERSFSKLKRILKLYVKEKYVLLVRRDFEVLVSFKRGATSLSALRSIWQANWLYENGSLSENVNELLEQSLLELEERFDDFMQQLEETGWDTYKITVKVPKEPFIEELDPILTN